MTGPTCPREQEQRVENIAATHTKICGSKFRLISIAIKQVWIDLFIVLIEDVFYILAFWSTKNIIFCVQTDDLFSLSSITLNYHLRS